MFELKEKGSTMAWRRGQGRELKRGGGAELWFVLESACNEIYVASAALPKADATAKRFPHSPTFFFFFCASVIQPAFCTLVDELKCRFGSYTRHDSHPSPGKGTGEENQFFSRTSEFILD